MSKQLSHLATGVSVNLQSQPQDQDRHQPTTLPHQLQWHLANTENHLTRRWNMTPWHTHQHEWQFHYQNPSTIQMMQIIPESVHMLSIHA